MIRYVLLPIYIGRVVNFGHQIEHTILYKLIFFIQILTFRNIEYIVEQNKFSRIKNAWTKSKLTSRNGGGQFQTI